MQDYSFTYNEQEYKVPKAKIFECLYELGEIVPIGEFQGLGDRSNSMKAAKVFCVMGSYAKTSFDPIEITQNYLHNDDLASEIYIAIGGLVSLLNPPESYHPPESKEAGK